MTLPDLMNSTDKQTTVSNVKEAYSIFTQATSQINNDCGGDITGCLSNPNAPGDNAAANADVANLYRQKLSVAKDCPTSATTGCFADTTYKFLNNTPWTNFGTNAVYDNTRMVLANGTSVCFEWYGPTTLPPYYFFIYIDVNGTKAPNQIGKDTFTFYYNMNQKLVVLRSDNDCNTSSNGLACAAKIIQEGAINYY